MQNFSISWALKKLTRMMETSVMLVQIKLRVGFGGGKDFKEFKT